MVRAFSQQEKESIKRVLMDKGRELFSSQGLKKTGVGELARLAGIAQGSFYIFFGSKEELFFEILEEEEEKLKAKFSQLLKGELTKDKITGLIKDGLMAAGESPIIKQMMDPETYQRIVRKLPPEKVKEHLDRDADSLLPIIKHWQGQGRMEGQRPEVVSGLLRSVFLLSLHKSEIGEDIFPEVIDLLAEFIAIGLVGEGLK